MAEVRLERRLELDDPAAHSDSNRLGAIAGPRLFHNMLVVALYRLFRDEKFVGDIPVAVAPGDITKNFNLATSESFVAVVFSQVSAISGVMRFFPAWTWRITPTRSLGGVLFRT